MISALLSFLGGNVFRMVFGEIVSYFNKRQEHAQELERMKWQAEVDIAQHARNMESIKTQHNLGVQTINVQSEAAIAGIEAEGWLEAVRGTTKTIGVWFIDAWNASIRPGVATWSIFMITFSEFGLFILSDNAMSVCSAALGIYLADRSLFKRGK